MNTIYALIALPVAAALLIEAFDRMSMHLAMDRRVAALKLNPNAICAECGCKQVNHDYRKQQNIHRTFSFGPMKRLRA